MEMIPAIEISAAPAGPAGTPVEAVKGSWGLFFRKVYFLASVRLRHLCASLQIPDEHLAKAWTMLEHVMVHETSIFKDRHLDQVILCCVYALCKLFRIENTFLDITQSYKYVYVIIYYLRFRLFLCRLHKCEVATRSLLQSSTLYQCKVLTPERTLTTISIHLCFFAGASRTRRVMFTVVFSLHQPSLRHRENLRLHRLSQKLLDSQRVALPHRRLLAVWQGPLNRLRMASVET